MVMLKAQLARPVTNLDLQSSRISIWCLMATVLVHSCSGQGQGGGGGLFDGLGLGNLGNLGLGDLGLGNTRFGNTL